MKIFLVENEKKYFRLDQFISGSWKDYKDMGILLGGCLTVKN